MSDGPRTFPCHTCTTQPKIALLPGQTFKIGQTCGDEKFRYGSRLPEPGLKFFQEMEGTIFEVLVAEYIQLKLFRGRLRRRLQPADDDGRPGYAPLDQFGGDGYVGAVAKNPDSVVGVDFEV